jgi:hypothetical protein
MRRGAIGHPALLRQLSLRSSSLELKSWTSSYRNLPVFDNELG